MEKGIYNFRFGKHFKDEKEMSKFLEDQKTPTAMIDKFKSKSGKKAVDEKKEIIENG